MYIKGHWPPEATIAGNIAGSIPYFSDLKFIDMLGLNDYRIAQRDTSSAYNFPIWKLMDSKKLFTRQGRTEIVQEVTKGYLPWQLIPGHGKGDGKLRARAKTGLHHHRPGGGGHKTVVFKR